MLIQYWHAARPPPEVARLIESVAHSNPDIPHAVFDEATAEALIAAHHTPRELAAFRACAVPAMQADYFRYCAALALGGIYVDADFRCLAPLRPLLSGGATVFGRPEVPRGWPVDLFGGRERIGPYRIVANSFLVFPVSGHPLLELVLEVATANVERRIAEDVAVVTGPGVLTSLYLLDRLESFDAFLDYASDGVLAPTANLCCEVVGDPTRVSAAFAGVSIEPFARTREVVAEVTDALAYKSTEVHWLNHRGSIFRR